jgi:hypothetical protein
MRRNGRAAIDTCCGFINVYRTHYQSNVTLGGTYQKIEGSVKPISGTRCMESCFSGGV